MSISWISPSLGTAAFSSLSPEANAIVIDVRDLVDKGGNRLDLVREKINKGCELLATGHRVIVACDYGISRSNAIAVGIIARHESVSFSVALRRVYSAIGEKEIKIEPLMAVRAALGQEAVRSSSRFGVLITGGSGAIGKHLVEELSSNFDVFSPPRSELDLRSGVTKLELVAADRTIDCIVHLANPRIYTSNLAIGDAIVMLRNVLDFCVARNSKLIYLTGSEVFSGYRSSNLKASESLPLFPKGPYGECKYLCELMIEHSRQTQGIKCLLLRSSPVYGPGIDKPKFIYNFIEKIRSGNNIVTHLYNNGPPGLDLLYINDIVSAIKKALLSDINGTLHLGTGIISSTKRIAEILKTIFQSDCDVTSLRVDDDYAGVAMDASRADSEIDWRSAINIEEGLRKLVSHYLEGK